LPLTTGSMFMTLAVLGIPDSQGDRERHPVAVRWRSMFSASGLPVFGTIGDSGGCEKLAGRTEALPTQ
jgi:hypothetical protein